MLTAISTLKFFYAWDLLRMGRAAVVRLADKQSQQA